MQKSNWSARITLLVFATLILYSTGLFAQSHKKESVTHQKLFEKAKNTEFKGFTSMISFDDHNYYYAVKTSDIKSRYIKIRLLEQTFEDDYLVNIGTFDNLEYMVFLVKKIPGRENRDIEKIIVDYYNIANQELNKLDSEQTRLWLLQHDKYTK